LNGGKWNDSDLLDSKYAYTYLDEIKNRKKHHKSKYWKRYNQENEWHKTNKDCGCARNKSH